MPRMEIPWPESTPIDLPTLQRFQDKVVLNEETNCWLWTASTQGKNYAKGKGYGTFYSGGPRGVGKLVKAHRWIWEVFNGPTDLHVLHHCDTPPCVNPEHLFIGTNADNVADKIAKGRSIHPTGEALPQAKLTAEQVHAIRAAYKGPQHKSRPRTGPTTTEIAEQFGVSQGAVSGILAGKKWKSVL